MVFLFWRRGGGVEGDGCGWWSVEGGDDEGLLMAARKTVPTVALCYTFYFYFCIFYFVFFCYFFSLFCVDMGHFLIFLYFFLCYTNFGIPDTERRKRKKNLLIGQPQGSLSARIDTQCSFVDLKIPFSCGLPT